MEHHHNFKTHTDNLQMLFETTVQFFVCQFHQRQGEFHLVTNLAKVLKIE